MCLPDQHPIKASDSRFPDSDSLHKTTQTCPWSSLFEKAGPVQPGREGTGSWHQCVDTFHFPVAPFSICFAVVNLSWEYNLLLVPDGSSDLKDVHGIPLQHLPFKIFLQECRER